MQKDNPFSYLDSHANEHQTNKEKQEKQEKVNKPLDYHDDDSQLAFMQDYQPQTYNHNQFAQPQSQPFNKRNSGSFNQQQQPYQPNYNGSSNYSNSQANSNNPNNNSQNHSSNFQSNNRFRRSNSSFSGQDSLSMDELYIFDAQILSVKNEMEMHIVDLPKKLEDFLQHLSNLEKEEDYILHLEALRELKTQCDRATSREKELYEVLSRVENQGVRSKTIDLTSLESLLNDTKQQLSKMPNMNVIEGNPLLMKEFDLLDARMSTLSKEILRRSIYERATSIHYAIRPLRSVKSSIYYMNRFIQFNEPRNYLIRAIRMLARLRQLTQFLKQPVENNLNEAQIDQLKEVIRQGSHEWDELFLDQKSSVWDFGAFYMQKIPLMIPSIHDATQQEQISLSVIPDYLVHQVRILLNESGLRKKTI